jgi:hypothetical protein
MNKAVENKKPASGEMYIQRESEVPSRLRVTLIVSNVIIWSDNTKPDFFESTPKMFFITNKNEQRYCLECVSVTTKDEHELRQGTPISFESVLRSNSNHLNLNLEKNKAKFFANLVDLYAIRKPTILRDSH